MESFNEPDIEKIRKKIIRENEQRKPLRKEEKAWNVIKACTKGFIKADDPKVIEASKLVGEKEALDFISRYYEKKREQKDAPIGHKSTDALARRVPGSFEKGSK